MSIYLRKHIQIIKKIIISIAVIVGMISVLITGLHLNDAKKIIKSIIPASTLIPIEESFTELYFEDHTNLPKIVNPLEIYKFTFTIHNLEQQDMDYPYLVYLESNNKKIILDGGKVSIKNGEYFSINESFGPLKPLKIKITVELLNRNEKISFWMEQ